MGALAKSWLKFSCLFMLSVILMKEKSTVDARLMPALFLDPRNPIFYCPSKGINSIQVQMKDYITFKCPSETSNLGTQNSKLNYHDYYEVTYIIPEENVHDALTCNATSYPYVLMKCNKPQTSSGLTVRFSEISADNSIPTFQYGKTYYIIGTGTGLQAGINNKVGGRCSTAETNPETTYKMILKIKVCSYDETFVHKNCTVCRNMGCYNQGCGLYNSWQNWQYYRNISQMNADSLSPGYTKEISEIAQENKCIRRRRRTCSDTEFGCTGPNEVVEVVSCPVLKTNPNYQNCSSWVNIPGLYRNGTNSCFLRGYRNCSVGSLEKMTVTQWKMEETVCPITTRAPTATPCQKPVCEGWTSSNDTYTNATGNCFMLYKRNCVLPILSCKTYNVTERKLMSVTCPSKPYVESTSITPSHSTFRRMQTSSSSSQRTDVISNYIKPSKTIQECTTLYTQLPCTVVPSVTPVTKVAVDGKWTNWGDCQTGTCKYKCRNCTNPAPKNNGKQCVGDPIKDIVCDDKKDPNAGKREASTGEAKAKDYTSYVIPVVTCLLGVISGAIATHFIIRHKKRIHNRDYSAKLDPDTASCGTQETGMSNSNYKMDTLTKPTTPLA